MWFLLSKDLGTYQVPAVSHCSNAARCNLGRRRPSDLQSSGGCIDLVCVCDTTKSPRGVCLPHSPRRSVHRGVVVEGKRNGNCSARPGFLIQFFASSIQSIPSLITRSLYLVRAFSVVNVIGLNTAVRRRSQIFPSAGKHQSKGNRFRQTLHETCQDSADGCSLCVNVTLLAFHA